MVGVGRAIVANVVLLTVSSDLNDGLSEVFEGPPGRTLQAHYRIESVFQIMIRFDYLNRSQNSDLLRNSRSQLKYISFLVSTDVDPSTLDV